MGACFFFGVSVYACASGCLRAGVRGACMHTCVGGCVRAQIIVFNDLSLQFVPHKCNVFTITIGITPQTSAALLKQSTVT